VKRFLKDNAKLIVVAVVCLSFGFATPALAARTVAFAANSHKVDGKHAVSAGASVSARKGKLVATSRRSGRLPSNIIAKAPDSALLGGRPAASYIHDVAVMEGPRTVLTRAKRFGRASVTCPTGVVLSGGFKPVGASPRVTPFRTLISADGKTFSADGQKTPGTATATFSVFAVCAG
jgi:hypothetical protein